MSRASKYLRKKLSEGGQIPDFGAKLGKLKNPSKLDPNIPQNTGIAGGLLAQRRLEEDKAKQAESLQNKAANFQEAMATFKAQNPEAVSTPIPQQKQILPKGDAQVPLPTQLQQQQKLSYRNNVAQNTPEKIRERMGATPEQNQPAPSAQPPDDGMPPWMTNKQKAALTQVNAENQATTESPEYQEALQKFQDSKGQDSEAQALLEKLSGEMAAKQNAVAPQPRFTEASLMGVQGQQLQGNAPQRMAASAVNPTLADGEPDPNTYQGGSSSGEYTADWAAWNNSQKDNSGSNTAPQGPGTTDEEEDTTPTTTASTSTSKTIVEEPDKPKTEKYEKPGTPRDCSNAGARSRETCLVARKREQTAVSAWQAVEDSWVQYDSDLEQFQNFDPNDNTGSDTGNNNNNTGDDMSEDNQIEGDVGSSDYTQIKKSASGAPINIEQDRPDVTAPTVGVEKVSQAANTTTAATGIEELDDAEEIKRTEDDKISPTEIVAAQMGEKPVEPKASDFTKPGGGGVDSVAYSTALQQYEKNMSTWSSGNAVSAPTDSTAAEMTASTIGQELPIRPLSTDFGADEEGRRKLQAARESYNVQIEELRGEERPRFRDFDGNREAYDQALRDFQEAPLPVTEEVKAAQGSIEEGSKAIATQADGTVSEGAKATAATRDTIAEEAALAGTEEFKENADSTVKAVTGKVATVEEWKDSTAAEAREGELPVKPLPTDFEGGATSEAYKQAQSEYNAELEDIRGMPFPKRENYDSTAEFNAAKKKFQEEPYMAREALQREAIVGEPATGEAAEIMSMYDYNQSQKRAIQGAKAKTAAVKKLKVLGLTDEKIAQRLADNPDLIADEMEDMPEDVRTTLSGLPKEALIDVQMESLMSGMEDGEVPAWARPALAKVEANLAKRGMTASSVGRDALFNAIIQSAIPMAQANASAIQGATAQDKQIAADFLAKNAGFQQQMNLANMSNDQQMRLANLTAQNQASSENLNAKQQIELTNLNAKLQTNLLQGKIAAEMGVAQLNVDQQTAVVNAQTSAGIDMAKYNAAQQVELTNSKFMQTMVATEFNADQQAAMQNATAMASMDMANLDKNTKLAVTNAQAFLQMDMANLSNEQQASVLTAQQRQQALLSNQSAENAAAQFNAANQQQADQFMQNLGVQVEQYNASANSARDQFNTTEKNRIAALNAGNELQAQQFEAQLDTDIAKFNGTQDFQRDQWNAANAQAVEQSNVQWRRQANLADTAAQNAANQQNAQISYNLTSQELTQVWQQMRDEAAYIRQSFENEEQRKAQLLATAIGNEKLAEKFDKGSNQAAWLEEISNAIN